MIHFVPTSYKNDNPWDKSEKSLWLLTPDEVNLLQDGVTLTSILDSTAITGTDYVDLDTRFGYTAWGVYEEDFSHI